MSTSLALRTEDLFVRPEDAPIPPALLDARVLVFVQSSGDWSQGGHLVSSDVESAGQLSSSLREGRFETAAPLWRDVLIGGQRYRLHHSR